jgi:hypothetical protein
LRFTRNRTTWLAALAEAERALFPLTQWLEQTGLAPVGPATTARITPPRSGASGRVETTGAGGPVTLSGSRTGSNLGLWIVAVTDAIVIIARIVLIVRGRTRRRERQFRRAWSFTVVTCFRRPSPNQGWVRSGPVPPRLCRPQVGRGTARGAPAGPPAAEARPGPEIAWAAVSRATPGQVPTDGG